MKKFSLGCTGVLFSWYHLMLRFFLPFFIPADNEPGGCNIWRLPRGLDFGKRKKRVAGKAVSERIPANDAMMYNSSGKRKEWCAMAESKMESNRLQGKSDKYGHVEKGKAKWIR